MTPPPKKKKSKIDVCLESDYFKIIANYLSYYRF